MRFVDDDLLEWEQFQDVLGITQKHLKTCDEDIELAEFGVSHERPLHLDIDEAPFVMATSSSSLGSIVVMVEDPIHDGPLINSTLPVLKSAERSQYQEGSLHVLHREQVVEEGDRLNGLSKSHLVSQDHISAMVPTLNQPIQTLKLVTSEHLPLLEDWLVLLSVLEQFLSAADIQVVEFVSHVSTSLVVDSGLLFRIIGD